MKHLVALATYILFANVVLAAGGSYEDLLNAGAATVMQRTIAAGDTRFIAIPKCSAEIPSQIIYPRSLLPEEGPAEIDPGCRFVYGDDGAERLRKIEAFAREYNQLMLEHIKSQGLFTIYPSNLIRQPTPTDKEKKEVEIQAKDTVIALFGNPLPGSVTIKSTTLGKEKRIRNPQLWDGNVPTFDEISSRLWITGKIAPEDFDRQISTATWREIPIPWEVIRPMHLPQPTSRTFMTCFLGKIADQPTFLFWSRFSSEYAIVVALVPPEYPELPRR